MIVLLDTLIGFAVVMVGVRPTIVSLNQAMTPLAAHGEANLKWG